MSNSHVMYVLYLYSCYTIQYVNTNEIGKDIYLPKYFLNENDDLRLPLVPVSIDLFFYIH